MSISILSKKPQPTAEAATTARVALKDHLAVIASLNRQRQAIGVKDTAAHRKLEAAKTAANKVTELRTNIDKALADAMYAEVEPPDLTAQRRALADAERDQAELAADARALEAVRIRFASDIAKLNDQLRALQDQTPRLVHAAAVEEMAGLATEFREKEEAFRAIHSKAFALVALADQIAMQEHLGQFQGVGLYGELNITRPNHPLFERGSSDPWRRQMEHNAAIKALDEEAVRLQALLLSETE